MALIIISLYIIYTIINIVIITCIACNVYVITCSYLWVQEGQQTKANLG